MGTIKRGTTPTLSVQIDGITPSGVSTVEFIFKLACSEAGKTVLQKSFPGDVRYDAESEMWMIPLTEQESRAFVAGATVYMDTRITLSDGTIPMTDIASFRVSDTLFEAMHT